MMLISLPKTHERVYPLFDRSSAGTVGIFALALAACAGDLRESEGNSEAALASSAAPGPASTPGLVLSPHTTLGIPEAASPTDPQHALLVKPQYVVSFDSHRKNPRWTSWELTTKWLGSTSRSPAFLPDPALPSSMPEATDNDYRGSGFERGHICPSADRTSSVPDNEATFVFTNAVPQTNASNTGTWETLESEERTLAKAGNHLFIIAGSLYATNQTIGAGVAVPSSMFKVVVVLHGDHPVPTDVTTTTRVISVDIPNTTTVTGTFRSFRTSFGSLEAKTGLHFLSDVPAAVHDALAVQVDSQ
jgi:endonuclease G